MAITPDLAAPAASRAWPAPAATVAGAGLVAFGGGALYLATLAPGLGGTIDSAEFQHAAYNLGIVHPTGYPLYLLLGRLWLTVFPFGGVAWRMNLLSAVCAVAALLVVYATVVHLTRSPVGGLLAAALAGTHALVWQTAVVAEVNSLNLLLAAAALYALLRWGAPAPDGRPWPIEVPALLTGLMLSHHRSSALLLPGIAVFAIWRIRQGAPLGRAAAARAVGLFLLPWLAYLYVPLRADTTPWYTNTWANFVAEVSGDSAWPVIVDTLRHPLGPRVGLVAATIFPSALGAATAALAALGLLGWAGRPRLGWRAVGVAGAVVALYGLGFLAVAGMMVIYDVDVIGDYLALAVLLAATWAGVAAAWALSWLRARGAGAPRWAAGAATVAALALLALPALQAQQNVAAADFHGYDLPAEFWSAPALQTLGPHGIVIGDWARYNELRYRQIVEGWRPDLYPVVLDDLLAGDQLHYVDDWLAQGRPVYLLDGTPDILDHFAALPQGAIWQLTHRQEVAVPPLAHPLDVIFGGTIHLRGYTLQPEQPHPGGTLRVTLYWETTARLPERYVEFTHLIDDQLQKIGQKDDEPGHGFHPTTDWVPGQVVTDTLVLPIAPGAAPGSYRLIVGLYTRVGAQRLQATTGAGVPLGDYWEMTPVRVVP